MKNLLGDFRASNARGAVIDVCSPDAAARRHSDTPYGSGNTFLDWQEVEWPDPTRSEDFD